MAMLRERLTQTRGLSTFADVARILRDDPLLFLGFGMFWIWVWYVFQSPAVGSFGIETSPLGILPWVLPLSSYAAGFFVLGLLYYRKRVIPKGRLYKTSIPIMMSVGLVACSLFPLPTSSASSAEAVIYTCGSVMLGVSSAFLHVEWGRLSGILGPRRTIVHGSCGTVFASAAIAVIANAPVLAAVSILVVFSWTSTGVVFASMRDRKDVYARGSQAELRISAKFIATAFVQGCSLGILQIILFKGQAQVEGLTVSAAGFALGALLVLVIALVCKMDFNRLMYHLGFPIMAFGCLLIALLVSSVMLGGFVHAVGYRFVDILIWALMAYVMKYNDLSANWVSSIATSWLITGQFFGTFCGWTAITLLGMPQGMVVPSMVTVFALLLCALLATSTHNLRTGWGMVRPGESEQGTSRLETCCGMIAQEYGLTTREKEVFSYLAQGFPRKFICEKLVVADGTVKAHTRNIYQKLDIHSRQDAMKLVESYVENFAMEEDAGKATRPVPFI